MLLFLALAHADTLYAIDYVNDIIVAYDTLLGTRTPHLPLGFNYGFGDLAYDDILQRAYILHASGLELYTWDLRRGTLTRTGSLPVAIDAADVDPLTGDIFGVELSSFGLVRVDPTTLAVTHLGVYHPFVATGAYWDVARDRLIADENATWFHAWSRTGGYTYLGGSGVFMPNNDFDIDSTGIIWSFNSFGTRTAIDGSSLTTIFQTSGFFNSDALFIDNGLLAPGARITATGPVSCPGPVPPRIAGLTPEHKPNHTQIGRAHA